jgi:hypothetical protein
MARKVGHALLDELPRLKAAIQAIAKRTAD